MRPPARLRGSIAPRGPVPRAALPAAAGQGPRRLPARVGLRGRRGAVRRGHAGDPGPDRDRAAGHHVDGVLGLLPDRLGPDPVRARQRHPGRPRSRLGCGLRRVVRAPDHGPGPAEVRAHLRALPEPRARPDARHRHGLRRAQAGRGHPLRGPEVRPGPRRADHHVPNDQGETGDPRRSQGARLPGVGRRPALQDVSGCGDGARLPDRAGPRALARAEGCLPQGARGQGDRRHGTGAGGPPPRGLGARGRRRDRRRAARELPALEALEGFPRRLAADRHAVRHARRREARPAQDGLPRAAEPLGHRGHACPPAAQGHRARHRPRPARRPGRLHDAPEGRHDRRVPDGERRHAEPDPGPRAGPVRGPDGPRRLVPAGPAERRHARRVRGAQARPSQARVPARRPRGHPGQHVRRDGLPGAGDADRGAAGLVLDG